MTILCSECRPDRPKPLTRRRAGDSRSGAHYAYAPAGAAVDVPASIKLDLDSHATMDF